MDEDREREREERGDRERERERERERDQVQKADKGMKITIRKCHRGKKSDINIDIRWVLKCEGTS